MSHFTPWPGSPPLVADGEGVTVHNQLSGRSTASAHPTSAITNLDATLALRQRVATAPVIVPNGGTIPAGTANPLLLGTTATLPDATTHGLGQILYIAAIGVDPCVLSASGSDLLAFGAGITIEPGLVYGISASDLDAFAPGAISWGIVSTSLPPASVQALIDASAPTVDDLGFDVDTEIIAAVEDVLGDPYPMEAPYDENLSGYLLWLALRDANQQGAIVGLGDDVEQVRTTVQIQALTGDPGETAITIGVTGAGRLHWTYYDDAATIVLAQSPEGSGTSWADGTRLYFLHANTQPVTFVGSVETGDETTIQTTDGTLPTMTAEWALVTAVYREVTAEWVLTGDLDPSQPPHVWTFLNRSADFTLVADFDYNHYAVDSTGGDVEVTLPDAGGTVGLPIRVQKVSGDANDVLLVNEDGLTTYYTITTASTVEVIWNGSAWLVLPY